MSETVTRIRKGAQTGTDGFNQPIYGPDVETDIDGALFAPGGSSEPIEAGRAPVITEPTLYFPDARPDIAEDDRVRVRGVIYHVDGNPADWHWGDDLDGGLVVTLRKVGG